MRQHEKYQTICDYALTISHDMGVIHDVKRYETPMQKLQEIISAFGRLPKNLENKAFSRFSFCLEFEFCANLEQIVFQNSKVTTLIGDIVISLAV